MFGNLTFDLAKPQLIKLMKEQKAKSLILSLDDKEEFHVKYYSVNVEERIGEIKKINDSNLEKIKLLDEKINSIAEILSSKKSDANKLKSIKELL